jgi:hypothetical protein
LTVWKSENDGREITKSKQEMPYLLDGYIWKYILLIEHENSGKNLAARDAKVVHN